MVEELLWLASMVVTSTPVIHIWRMCQVPIKLSQEPRMHGDQLYDVKNMDKFQYPSPRQADIREDKRSTTTGHD